MDWLDVRLRIKHFIKKYKKTIIVIFTVWWIIIMINNLILNREIIPEATKEYTPHISLMDKNQTAPKPIRKPIEKLIKKYVEFCNQKEYEKAFNLLSEECRQIRFENNPNKFIEYVLVKIPTYKEYHIQLYSVINIDKNKIYIYEIKYTEDILSTGLNGKDYYYTSEKIAFSADEFGNINMGVDGYISENDIKNIFENEDIKIDVLKKVTSYSTEKYFVKFTNHSENTIIISNGDEDLEVGLQLTQETRKRTENNDIILKPYDNTTEIFTFPKYIDDDDTAKSLDFNLIRVVEKYLISNDINDENNTIAKFSVSVPVV